MKQKSLLQQERYLERRVSEPINDLSSIQMTSVDTKMIDKQGNRIVMPEVNDSKAKPRVTNSAKPGYRNYGTSKLEAKPTLERFIKTRDLEQEKKANLIQNKLYYRFKVKIE